MTVGARTALAIRFQMALVEWLHKVKAGGYGLLSWCLNKATGVVSASRKSTQQVNWVLFVISLQTLPAGIQLYPDRDQSWGQPARCRTHRLELVGDIQTSFVPVGFFYHSDHPVIL